MNVVLVFRVNKDNIIEGYSSRRCLKSCAVLHARVVPPCVVVAAARDRDRATTRGHDMEGRGIMR